MANTFDWIEKGTSDIESTLKPIEELGGKASAPGLQSVRVAQPILRIPVATSS